MGSSVKRLAITAVGIAVGGYVGGKLTTAFTLGKTASLIATGVVSAGVQGALSKALITKPKGNLRTQLDARTEMVKQPIIPRETVYGEVKKSGGIIFLESTNNNQDLHIIVQLASHEIQSIDEVYFGDDQLTLASAGTDVNGVTQFKVTAPSKYATESKFATKTRTLIVSNYVDVKVRENLPFGGYQIVNGKGITKDSTSITLISDTAFSVSTADKININGVEYGISSGGSSSASGSRHTLAVTISEGLRTDVKATSITYGAQSPSGQIQTRITPYRNNPNTPLPFLSGTSTTTNYAIIATQSFSDASNLTVRIKKHLGSDTQQADADLVNEVPQWTTSHMLSGIAYLYVRLKYDADAFPSGIPNISAEIKGKKILDIRTGSTAFSSNPALILYDFLSDSRYGLSVPTSQIDSTSFSTMANTADEDIALAAGGTENRYEAHGIVYSNISPMESIDEILGSMLGILSYSNGQFILAGGKYVAPSLTLTEDDFIGASIIQTKTSRRNLFNTAKGIFTSPESNWQPSDYPMVTSSTFVAEDAGETIFGNIDLPFTTSSTMAQRIAKVALFKNRQQMILQVPMKLSAFTLQVGDTVQITVDRLGFSSKKFQVDDWTFNG